MINSFLSKGTEPVDSATNEAPVSAARSGVVQAVSQVGR